MSRISHRLSRVLGASVLAVALALSATSCSGDAAPTTSATPDNRPAKDSVKEGLTKLMTTTGNPTTAQKMASCIVDATYDKLSVAMLESFAKADKTYKPSSQDEATFTDASTACVTEAMR